MTTQNNEAIRRTFRAKGLNDPQDWFEGVADCHFDKIMELLSKFTPKTGKLWATDSIVRQMTKQGLTKVKPRLAYVNGEPILHVRRNLCCGVSGSHDNTPQYVDSTFRHLNLREVITSNSVKSFRQNKAALYLYCVCVFCDVMGRCENVIEICGVELIHSFICANAGWNKDEMSEHIELLTLSNTDVSEVLYNLTNKTVTDDGFVNSVKRDIKICPVNCTTANYAEKVTGGNLILSTTDVYYLSGKGASAKGCALPKGLDESAVNELWSVLPFFLLNSVGYSWTDDVRYLRSNSDISMFSADEQLYLPLRKSDVWKQCFYTLDCAKKKANQEQHIVADDFGISGENQERADLVRRVAYRFVPRQ
jgi:hypothetical protein